VTVFAYWLVFDVNRELEEKAVDALLALETAHGFSSFPIDYRHFHPIGLSPAEQVAGRQKKIRFQMEVGADNLEALLAHLHCKLSGANIDYRVLPLIAGGSW
jgi:hypothetical protein